MSNVSVNLFDILFTGVRTKAIVASYSVVGEPSQRVRRLPIYAGESKGRGYQGSCLRRLYYQKCPSPNNIKRPSSKPEVNRAIKILTRHPPLPMVVLVSGPFTCWTLVVYIFPCIFVKGCVRSYTHAYECAHVWLYVNLFVPLYVRPYARL